jgi:hypothetical protein
MMIRDPIVEEVRAVRERLASEFNFDIRAIVADAQRRQATSNRKVVSFQQEPVQGKSKEANDSVGGVAGPSCSPEFNPTMTPPANSHLE